MLLARSLAAAGGASRVPAAGTAERDSLLLLVLMLPLPFSVALRSNMSRIVETGVRAPVLVGLGSVVVIS